MYWWIKKAITKKESRWKIQIFLGKFEKRYLDLGKGKYFLGEKFTLADIFLSTALPTFEDTLGLEECPYKNVAPNLGELIKRIKELKEFYEKFFIKSKK